MDIKSRESVRSGQCAIERFWGQTVIYMPYLVVSKIGKNFIENTAREIFAERLKKENYLKLYVDEELCELELPSVLEFSPPGAPFREHKFFSLPDQLVERIMSAYQRSVD